MTRWEKVFYGVLAVILIAGIAGCSTGKALLDACKDGLCR